MAGMRITLLTGWLAGIAIAVMLGGCGVSRLAEADMMMSRGEYYDASRAYRKVYNSLAKKEQRALRGEVAFKMGECYFRINRMANASQAFRNAIRYGYSDSTASLYLGRALQAEGEYTKAIEAYNDYLATSPRDAKMAENGIAGCRHALSTRSVVSRYVVKNPKLFNSNRSDFAPFLDPVRDMLYITTTNERVNGDARSEITGMKNSDLWMSRRNEQGDWMRPEPLEGDVNSEYDEGIAALSPDGMTMYLTVAKRDMNRDTAVGIYTSRRSDARWSRPVRLEIDDDSVASYGHPSPSPDGKWLYFTSDRRGGYGGKDIWRMRIDRDGARPENLGPLINTVGDEMFPTVRDDSLLYFASNGHPGYGGLDIYCARLLPSGAWSVVNMGKPVNSAGDDFAITFGEGESGFFSSNRGDRRGYDHIYSFVLPDLRISIGGHVTDRDEEPIGGAVVRIVGDDGTNRKAVARNDGSFSLPLQRGVRYVMLATAPGYLNAKQEFISDDAEEDAEYAVDFMLASLTRPNVIDNIFYDFDKATLRPESRQALDSLAQVLHDNPNVTIELAAHTDRKGSEEYNVALSQRRAQSVIDYLIASGIDTERLKPVGYGESQPKRVTRRLHRLYPQFAEGDVLDEEYIGRLDEANQEIADQINRRTEFQVLSIDYKMY